MANDRAEDIRVKPELAGLQAWGVETLDRFRAGQVETNGSASYRPMGDIQLAVKEIPPFIARQWGSTNNWGEVFPEISIRLSADGQPECVMVTWGLQGIAVGPPNYRLSFQPWCSVEAKPGVYTYYLYK